MLEILWIAGLIWNTVSDIEGSLSASRQNEQDQDPKQEEEEEEKEEGEEEEEEKKTEQKQKTSIQANKTISTLQKQAKTKN